MPTETLTTTVQAVATRIAVSSAETALFYADMRGAVYVSALFLAALVGFGLLVFVATVARHG